jgi:hypothetical protein
LYYQRAAGLAAKAAVVYDDPVFSGQSLSHLAVTAGNSLESACRKKE